VDLDALVRAAGADLVYSVDPEDAATTRAVLEKALAAERLAVVISRGACPRT
jgi:TPP-dependent indolepyruvate ferredoxin oxidoreductase alpha subunit